tara:strand:+ start:4912 stop:5370 length:459 start_codon:yes stop_codon:yes gene_type:complete
MVWKYGDVQLKAGKGWTDKDGTKHPNNWMIWDDYYKTTMGLKWEDDPVTYDNRFYDSAGKAKDLAELKTTWKTNTKTTAYGILAKTDWYVTRKSELGTAIPNSVSKYRASVKSAVVTIETAIDNASDLDAFKALFESNDGATPVINNFPEES